MSFDTQTQKDKETSFEEPDINLDGQPKTLSPVMDGGKSTPRHRFFTGSLWMKCRH